MSPQVSVILPTFNRADTLPRSVVSVLEQTYGDLELIIVDDGSTDNTAAIVRDHKDTRIHYIGLAHNRGQAHARNIGIAKSQGTLIAFQDSDDTWESGKLAKQVHILDCDQQVAGVYCDLLRIPRTGKPFVIEAPDLVRGATFDGRRSLYHSYSVGIQSCVLRKEALKRCGKFREDMRCFEDLELLLRLARGYRLRRIPEALVNYYESVGVSEDTTAECDARLILFRRHGYRGLFANRQAWLREFKFYLLHKTGRLRPERMAGGLGGWTDPKRI